MTETNYDLIPWTPFETASLPDGPLNDRPIRVYMNSRYQVNLYKVNGGPIFGDVAWLSIKALDKQARHDWRDMQRIKNEIIGEEYEGIEIFPAESRLVDTANQYHLWVFMHGFRMPFGFNERIVCDAEDGVYAGARQRPFERGARPDDCLNAEQMNARVQAATAVYVARREAERRSSLIVMAAIAAVIGEDA